MILLAITLGFLSLVLTITCIICIIYTASAVSTIKERQAYMREEIVQMYYTLMNK